MSRSYTRAMEQRKAAPRRAIAAGVAILAIAVGLIASHTFGDGDGDAAAAAADTSAGNPGDTTQVLLRLHDLPLGYRWAGGFVEFSIPMGCHPIEPAGAQPRLAAFLARYSPTGCMALYTRLFRLDGEQPAPLAVGTGAIDAGSVKGAEAGLAVSRELLSHLLGDELPTEVLPPMAIGGATRLFHWEHGGLFAKDEHSSSFLVWRSGGIVASIFVGGGSAASNDREAVELARLQQARIEAPSPYTPAEADDTEVPLEDPELAGTGPYDSFKGMAVIAQGLELRPGPVFPPAGPP